MFKIMGKDLSHAEVAKEQPVEKTEKKDEDKWAQKDPTESLEVRKARLKMQRDKLHKAKEEKRQKELEEYNLVRKSYNSSERARREEK